MILYNLHTGKSGCFFVGTDSDDVTADFGLIQYQRHNHYQDDNPKETDGIHGIADLNTEDAAEPSLGCTGGRPGHAHTACYDRTDTSDDHHGTQGSDERRQIQDRYQYTVKAAEQYSYYNCYQHTHAYRHAEVYYAITADQCISDCTGTDGKVNTCCDQTERYADSHQCDVIGITQNT